MLIEFAGPDLALVEMRRPTVHPGSAFGAFGGTSMAERWPRPNTRFEDKCERPAERVELAIGEIRLDRSISNGLLSRPLMPKATEKSFKKEGGKWCSPSNIESDELIGSMLGSIQQAPRQRASIS
jgi:hypothetical protein